MIDNIKIYDIEPKRVELDIPKVSPSEPIMYYADDLKLGASLSEWKERLFLSDWIIKAVLVEESTLEGQPQAGICEFQFNHKSARIEISKQNREERIAKCPQEKTLVHELLHLKYNWVEAPKSYEGVYVDETEHALLEQMAKSLVMAKYGIPFSWFTNEGSII